MSRELWIIPILTGLVLLLFARQLSEMFVIFQNQNYNFKFGKKEIKMGTVANYIGGVVFIVLGILMLLGIVETR